jgi:hypothetical protein
VKWRPVPRLGLVEFLIIAAMAAVLASLLFPIFAQARLRARDGICLTNMKQILVAARMYGEDYDGALPQATGSDSNDSRRVVPLQPLGAYR